MSSIVPETAASTAARIAGAAAATQPVARGAAAIEAPTVPGAPVPFGAAPAAELIPMTSAGDAIAQSSKRFAASSGVYQAEGNASSNGSADSIGGAGTPPPSGTGGDDDDPRSKTKAKTSTDVMTAAETSAPEDLASQVAHFLRSPTKATASRRAQALRRQGIEGIAALLAIRAPFELRYRSHTRREKMTATDIEMLQVHHAYPSRDNRPNAFRSKEYHRLPEAGKAIERALEQVDLDTICSLLTHPNLDTRFGAISRILVAFDYHTKNIHSDISVEHENSFHIITRDHLPVARSLAELLLKQALTDPNQDIRDYLVSLIRHDLTKRPMRFDLVWRGVLWNAPEPLRHGAREISREIRFNRRVSSRNF